MRKENVWPEKPCSGEYGQCVNRNGCGIIAQCVFEHPLIKGNESAAAEMRAAHTVKKMLTVFLRYTDRRIITNGPERGNTNSGYMYLPGCDGVPVVVGSSPGHYDIPGQKIKPFKLPGWKKMKAAEWKARVQAEQRRQDALAAEEERQYQENRPVAYTPPPPTGRKCFHDEK